MVKCFVMQSMALSFFCLIAVACQAQSANKLIGLWATEEHTVVQIAEENKVLVGKQAGSNTEKYKPYNGKVILRNITQNSNNELSATLVDPGGNKEFKSKLILSNDGKTLIIRVKIAFVNYDVKWSSTK